MNYSRLNFLRVLSHILALTGPIWLGASEAAGDDLSTEVKRLISSAKEKGEGELNLSWGGAIGFPESAKRFESLFNRMYGTTIKLNFTPGPPMPEMAGRITMELAAGRKASTDVYAGTVEHFANLLNRNVLEEYDYSQLSGRIPSSIVAPKNIGVQVYSSLAGVIYNTRFVSPSEAPRKLEDILNPKWKGKVASTPYAAYFDRIAMRPEWDSEKMKAFIRKLSDQVGGLMRATETSRVSSGEFIMFALGHSMSFRQEAKQGAPLGFAIPEDGAVSHYGYLGVPRNSTHPNLAKLFINAVVSEAGQRIIYETYHTDHLALPGSQSAADFRDLKARGVKILEINVQLVTKYPDMAQLTDEMTKILRQKSSR